MVAVVERPKPLDLVDDRCCARQTIRYTLGELETEVESVGAGKWINRSPGVETAVYALPLISR